MNWALRKVNTRPVEYCLFLVQCHVGLIHFHKVLFLKKILQYDNTLQLLLWHLNLNRLKLFMCSTQFTINLVLISDGCRNTTSENLPHWIHFLRTAYGLYREGWEKDCLRYSASSPFSCYYPTRDYLSSSWSLPTTRTMMLQPLPLPEVDLKNGSTGVED